MEKRNEIYASMVPSESFRDAHYFASSLPALVANVTVQ